MTLTPFLYIVIQQNFLRSHVCVRAPSNSDVDFLLSQVSHSPFLRPLVLDFFSHFLTITSSVPTLTNKRHVVFNKTTRRFASNDTSFFIKHHVVFHQTSRRFSSNITSFSLLFERIPHIFPNECYKDIANNCPIVFYDEPCDTCDSKKVKTPVMRARARTREGVFKICLRYNFLQKKIAVR